MPGADAMGRRRRPGDVERLPAATAATMIDRGHARAHRSPLDRALDLLAERDVGLIVSADDAEVITAATVRGMEIRRRKAPRADQVEGGAG